MKGHNCSVPIYIMWQWLWWWATMGDHWWWRATATTTTVARFKRSEILTQCFSILDEICWSQTCKP